MSRIVVIGHGASPDGRGWGRKIDAHPVVRLHDCHWQDSKDHGSRYDFGVLPGPWLDRASKSIERVPARGWLCYMLAGRPVRMGPPAVLKNRPVSTYGTTLESVLDPLGRYAPTRGLMAIVMGVLKTGAKEVVLVGFDGLLSGHIGPYSRACPSRPAQGSGGARSGRHAYDLERRALADFALRAGVRFVDAGVVW